MVLESIYDPEFPDTSHFRSGRGRYSALRRSKFQYICFIFKQFSSLNLNINSIVLDDKREKSCNFVFQVVLDETFTGAHPDKYRYRCI